MPDVTWHRPSPRQADSPMALYRKIVDAAPDMPESMPHEAASFISRTLVCDPAKRLGAVQTKDVSSLPWRHTRRALASSPRPPLLSSLHRPRLSAPLPRPVTAPPRGGRPR